MDMKCSSGTITETSIQIIWTNNYPECFKVSVLVDDVLIQDEIANETNYTIRHLNSHTVYNVCVVARDGLNRTNSSWTDCDTIRTGMCCELIHVSGQ